MGGAGPAPSGSRGGCQPGRIPAVTQVSLYLAGGLPLKCDRRGAGRVLPQAVGEEL